MPNTVLRPMTYLEKLEHLLTDELYLSGARDLVKILIQKTYVARRIRLSSIWECKVIPGEVFQPQDYLPERGSTCSRIEDNNKHIALTSRCTAFVVFEFSQIDRAGSSKFFSYCKIQGCKKSFKSVFKLFDHLRSHTNERPFVCNVHGCNKSYT